MLFKKLLGFIAGVIVFYVGNGAKPTLYQTVARRPPGFPDMDTRSVQKVK